MRVSPGISGTSQSSKLLLLWMFTSLLFATNYNGSLTSVVMKSPPDKRLPTIEDLEKHDYSAIFNNDVEHKLAKVVVSHRLYWRGRYTNLKMDRDLQKRLRTFKKIAFYATFMPLLII